MINEFVICDMCGTEIPKEQKHMWHNFNIVRHMRSVAVGNRDLTASFHVCTDDLKNLMFEVLGVDLDEKHQQLLTDKIGKKLRLWTS